MKTLKNKKKKTEEEILEQKLMKMQELKKTNKEQWINESVEYLKNLISK
mgnify:CR=1 FL=1